MALSLIYDKMIVRASKPQLMAYFWFNQQAASLKNGRTGGCAHSSTQRAVGLKMGKISRGVSTSPLWNPRTEDSKSVLRARAASQVVEKDHGTQQCTVIPDH